jgi:hypothetical protein
MAWPNLVVSTFDIPPARRQGEGRQVARVGVILGNQQSPWTYQNKLLNISGGPSTYKGKN